MTTSALDPLSIRATDLHRLFGPPPPPSETLSLPELISTMLDTGQGVSDLVFSPGRPPQVEKHGELTAVAVPGVGLLTTDDTASIARQLVAGHDQALGALRDQGACDLSYSLQSRARFRVNVFRQRGSYAIVMRVIATEVPTLRDLGLPASVADVAALKSGIVLVTGPTGAGKSSTLAAIINLINETRAEHIITIEDPVEFMHEHKKATVHQRELHSDTPTFALALRAALRQAPKVILVGEMRDRETMEIALTAAETGHLVFSTLHTIDASRTVDRIIGAFDVGDQQAIRTRLAGSFRCFISQRLVPRIGGGRVAVLEVLKSTLRTRDYIERGDSEGRSLLDAMRDGAMDGMQHFDGEIERLVREGVISASTALLHATNAGNLRVMMADVPLDVVDESLIER
ncbi:MAG TPA: PilT/PilU family type 4a pilus ATPase [Vicinamibacterales bacterium]|nr:PilT/PilU family type 4a pilus ATPase [Vicinamibacterales bacterium]